MSTSLINKLLLALTLLLVSVNFWVNQTYVIQFLANHKKAVGDVFYPMMLMALVLLGLTLVAFLAPERSEKTQCQVEKYLRLISFCAPTLGFVGTILGLQQGLANFAIADGVDQLLDAVGQVVQGLTVSLTSTLWGGIIGLLAGSVLMLIHGDANEPNTLSDNVQQQLNQVKNEIRLFIKAQGTSAPHQKHQKISDSLSKLLNADVEVVKYVSDKQGKAILLIRCPSSGMLGLLHSKLNSIACLLNFKHAEVSVQDPNTGLYKLAFS